MPVQVWNMRRSIFGIHGLWGSAYFIIEIYLESVHQSFVCFVFCNQVFLFVEKYIRLNFQDCVYFLLCYPVEPTLWDFTRFVLVWD